jgi:hypothetical protein
MEAALTTGKQDCKPSSNQQRAAGTDAFRNGSGEWRGREEPTCQEQQRQQEAAGEPARPPRHRGRGGSTNRAR